MIWIVGAVVSRTEGYNTLTNLIGAFVFHTVCMIGGALCLFNSRPQPALESQQPAQAAPKA